MKLKRNKDHGLGTLIASLQALLSEATSLEIFHSLRSLLTGSFQVSLGLLLRLYPSLHYRPTLEPHYAYCVLSFLFCVPFVSWFIEVQ